MSLASRLDRLEKRNLVGSAEPYPVIIIAPDETKASAMRRCGVTDPDHGIFLFVRDMRKKDDAK